MITVETSIPQGFAGGLNRDNVATVLDQLRKGAARGRSIWIDMESGLRSDIDGSERFDVNRAWAVCAALDAIGWDDPDAPKSFTCNLRPAASNNFQSTIKHASRWRTLHAIEPTVRDPPSRRWREMRQQDEAARLPRAAEGARFLCGVRGDAILIDGAAPRLRHAARRPRPGRRPRDPTRREVRPRADHARGP